MNSIVFNSIANASLIGRHMGTEQPLINVTDEIIDCAHKLAKIEAQHPNVWDKSTPNVNDWDTVCMKLAKHLNKIAAAIDQDKSYKKITETDIKKLMKL